LQQTVRERGFNRNPAQGLRRIARISWWDAARMEQDPLEQRLDQALEATFPASDPIAVSPTQEPETCVPSS
jgi:hypothetical protein